MKKKIALLLTIIFSLGALALTACTDNDKPRELTDIEFSVCGTWNNGYDDIYVFYGDGQYVHVQTGFNQVSSCDFYHNGEGAETDGAARGHYYIFKAGDVCYVKFDSYPDTLMRIENGAIDATDNANNFVRQAPDTNTNDENIA